MTRRILILLLWLYPPGFRHRFGADVRAAARRLDESGSAGARFAAVLDSVRTLGRAWWDRIVEGPATGASGARPGPSHVGRHGSPSGPGGPAWSSGPGGRGSPSGPGVAPASPSRGADLLRDARYALRSLARRPVHLVVAVGTLALGLGANGVVFDVAHAVLLQALPYDAPERVGEVTPPPVGIRIQGDEVVFRPLDWVADIPILEGVSMFTEDGGATMVEGPNASRIAVSQVSPGFFRTLGAPPALGRGFVAGQRDAAVLGHGLWRSAFGGDPGTVGRTLILSGRAYEIVGVAAPEVTFPGRTDVWVPFPITAEFYGAAIGPAVLVRGREGTEPATVRAVLAERAEAAAREAGEPLEPGRVPQLVPLRDRLVGSVRAPILALLAGSGLLLLLACANLAALTLSRTLSRLGELRVRRALGAGRGRVTRQLLTESLVVSLLGGAAATALAARGGPLLGRLLPAELPGRAEIGLDATLLLFLAAATVTAGLLAGGLPALQGAILATPTSRSAGHGRNATRSHGRLQAGLTVCQVGLAVVVATGAALLGRSLAHLHSLPPGFDREGVLTFEVRLPEASYPGSESRQTARERIEEELASLAGVQGVGSSSRLPFTDGFGKGFRVWPGDASEDDAELVSAMEASSGYFAALGIPVLEGRTFHPEGEAGFAVVLGEGAARALFGEAPAVGRRIRVRKGSRAEPDRATVVGVVADARYTSLVGNESSRYYEPLSANPVPWLGFAVRTGGDPVSLASAVREAVARVDPGLAPYGIRTTGQSLHRVLATQEALALVSSLFALASLLLAGLGVYGLMAQAVARRRREMGIRLALGADGGHVLGLVLRGGIVLALPGVVLGWLTTLVATEPLGGLLHGVGVRDPVTLAVVPLVTLAVAVVATALPARRAARTDPVGSLRAE